MLFVGLRSGVRNHEIKTASSAAPYGAAKSLSSCSNALNSMNCVTFLCSPMKSIFFFYSLLTDENGHVIIALHLTQHFANFSKSAPRFWLDGPQGATQSKSEIDPFRTKNPFSDCLYPPSK